MSTVVGIWRVSGMAMLVCSVGGRQVGAMRPARERRSEWTSRCALV